VAARPEEAKQLEIKIVQRHEAPLYAGGVTGRGG
jgi:hypothetical protein